MQSGMTEKKDDLQGVLADLRALFLEGKTVKDLEAELQAAKATCANQAAQLAGLTAENAQLKEKVDSLNAEKTQLQQTVEDQNRKDEERIRADNTPAIVQSRQQARDAMVKVPILEAKIQAQEQELQKINQQLSHPAIRRFLGR